VLKWSCFGWNLCLEVAFACRAIVVILRDLSGSDESLSLRLLAENILMRVIEEIWLLERIKLGLMEVMILREFITRVLVGGLLGGEYLGSEDLVAFEDRSLAQLLLLKSKLLQSVLLQEERAACIFA
jgi:hypothetical protein